MNREQASAACLSDSHIAPGVAAGNVKQVIAIVRPHLAEEVLEALKRAPLEALTVREVKGFGRQKSYLEQYVATEFAMAFLPKVEISVWVEEARVDEVVRRIVGVARSGRMGDGKIFVLPADDYERAIDIAVHSREDDAVQTGARRPPGARKKPRRSP
jgi:nitrogen regulatory protein PII